MIKKKITQIFKTRFPELLIPRASNSHKGTFGSSLVIGGDSGMTGAVFLASTAAALMGVGKSYAIFLDKNFNLPFFLNYPEIMLKKADNFAELAGISSIIIGCGMGSSSDAKNLFFKVLETQNCPLIIDADALNLIAKNPEFVVKIQNYAGEKLLTPHLGEASRLLKIKISEIENNRSKIAKELATKFNSWVILKGYQSLIVNPQGKIFINDSGNASLATAGTGDVLAGMIGGLVASGIEFAVAIKAGVWLHGATADFLSQGVPKAGLLASEIAKNARDLRHLATRENLN